jgi:hypothetical protein
MAGIIESANLLYVFLTDYIYSNYINIWLANHLLVSGLEIVK